MKTLLLLSVLTFSGVIHANQSGYIQTEEGSEMITMRVQAHKVACDGTEANVTCFMVQKGASIGTDFWEMLNEPIEGFDFVEGYTYDIQVRIEMTENTETGKSPFHYSMVKIISKTKV